ncbi:MAG: alanine--tRNA ligase-related protein, partial [Patescibacteria group bacterium]
YEPLKQKNVDTGMGLERVTAILQGKKTHYETELFQPVIERIRKMGHHTMIIWDEDERRVISQRIIADHLRAATFIMGDERGVMPSNQDQGYVLRRLVRRAIREGKKLGIQENFTEQLAGMFIELYGDFYKGLVKNKSRILEALTKEEEQFQKALANAEIEIKKNIHSAYEGLVTLQNADKTTPLLSFEIALNSISLMISDEEALTKFNRTLRPAIKRMREEFKGNAVMKTLDIDFSEISDRASELIKKGWTLRGDRAFYYFESFGLPIEITREIVQENLRGDAHINVDEQAFQKAYEAHQEKSRAGAEQKFAGGLADHSMESKKLHTATHLMLEALRRVLGKHVEQRGSNITQERLRFDFNFDRKMTPEEIAEVEKIVNDAIQADYPVTWKEMSVKEARDLDATGIFVDKYEGELDGKVKVYFMGDYSKEICGGPHVDHTGQLGKTFKISKEESSSSWVRRIKAVLA